MIITKERDEKAFSRGNPLTRTEFPKLILEEDNISRSEVEKSSEKTLSTREIITFLLFCTFFIIIVYLQVNIGESYNMNNSILTGLQANSQDFSSINVEDSYWQWLDSFTQSLYVDYYYDNFTIPFAKQNAIPNLNILASKIRITQRRMKLVPNDDIYTKAYITEGWASLGFGYLDDFDTSSETSASFGNNNIYTYQLADTYGGKGGYLQVLDTQMMNSTDAQNFVQDLQDNNFIDKQTRSIVIDLVLYNSYTDFFAMLNFIATFEANGLISTSIEIYDMKRDYYEKGLGYFRFICEICFCCLLIFYLIIEFIEILNDIRGQKRDFEKEQKKKQARENRRRDLLDQQRERIEAAEDGKLGNESNKHNKTPDVERAKGRGGDQGDVYDGFGDFQHKEEKQKQTKKGQALHYCKFFIGGLKQHYNDGWNWIDSLYLILSVVAVSMWATIARHHIAGISSQQFSDYRDVDHNEVFLSVSQQMLTYSNVCSINFILIFIKVLKYLASWFERVMIIFKTLSYAKSDIFYFLVMYIIIFFAFVVMCHIYYGADLTNFGTIFNSLTTLFLMLLGDLDALADMIVLNKVLSFFFFIAFMTSMQFILINMFIAFISNAYSAVNESISSSKKLEDELKQKHVLVKVQDAFKWLSNFLHKRRINKKQQQIRSQKQQELIKKNLQMKMQQIMMKVQLENQNEPEKDPADLRKERYLFGGDPNNPYSTSKGMNDSMSDKKGGDDFDGLNENSFEKQNISQLALGIPIFDEKVRKRSGTTNSNEHTSRLEDLGDDDLDSAANSDSIDDNLTKSRQRIEEEKAKIILTRKEWDKNFDQNQFFIEEPLLPALLSEKQDVQGKKDRELKCGKIMWASITFTLYAALYICLILFQLNVERNYWYNTAIQNAILGLQDYNGNSITSITSYSGLVSWLNEALPYLTINMYQPQTNFSGYYIQEVNYVLGDQLRLCFQISKPNPDLSTQNSTHESNYYKDGGSSDQYTQPFIGAYSSTQYTYSDGFQNQGGYCIDLSFDPDLYYSQINDFTQDFIISDQILLLTVEFVSFEASQYVHTYSTIIFNFPPDGSIDYNINIFTMKLNQYKSGGDLIRLGFEALYLLLLLYNMVMFIRKLLQKGRQYSRWKQIEIDSLSEIERRQRYQKAPEWIRKWNTLFTAFTYFDIIYFSLAITSISIWILLIQKGANLDFALPPSDANQGFIPKFYTVQRLLMNYTNVVAINTIFLSVKVFDYMNKSKHMNMLSNTLYSSKEDTFYFLIIFTIFLFGFVGMGYISFGAMLSDFNTIGNAIRKCFEITIGDFDYQSLETTNAPMAVLFFFPFNVLFVFILTNIFLAIINEAYEANQLSSEDQDSINILSSIFYCMIANEKQKQSKRKVNGIDKKAQQNDYLEVFEKLVVNLQISMSDLKAWAINCADEIKSELKKRTQLRHENREILMNKFKKMKSVEEGRSAGTGVAATGKRYDEVECYKKRLQYWDYIRNGIQFISFQNKILSAVLKQKEKEIAEKTDLYYKEKEKTQEIYKYLALLEKPVEDRLEQIMNYRKVLQLLEQEKNLLLNEEEKDEEIAQNDDENVNGDGGGDAMSANPSSKNDKGSGAAGRPSAKNEYSKRDN